LSLRNLHFDKFGLRYSLRAFSKAPTASNASSLGNALENAGTLVTVGRDRLAEALASPSGQRIIAAHPTLVDPWSDVKKTKDVLWELLFSPRSIFERVPFMRSRRYRRLAAEFRKYDLDRIFDELNVVVNRSLQNLAVQIAESEEEVKRLSERPRVTGAKR